MKICLIQPEVPQSKDEDLLGVYPPIGLMWLAGNCKGHKISVCDMRFNPLDTGPWDLVGISCQTVSYNNCHTVASAIHQEYPETVVVAGGHHPVPQELLTFADYVVRGEGEITFFDLLQVIEQGGDTPPGVFSRKKRALHRPPADITRLAPPDYECIPLKRYSPNQGAMVTSRGCPYSCIFCISPFGHTWRGRTPVQVVAEAEELYSRGARTLHIMDDLFTYDRDRVFSICEKIHTLGGEWDLPNGTRADTVDQDMLTAMAKSGCTRMLYGIESGVDSVLKAIKKQITTSQIEKAVFMTKKAGIQAEGLFMVGNPGDTPKTIKKTVEFIKKLDITAHFSLATPYPGTAFWRWVEQHGTFLDVLYQDFEQAPVFETPSFSEKERLHMLAWASAECT